MIKLLGNQNEDDIIFYKSIIDNSYFYLTNSLKIRKFKIMKDIIVMDHLNLIGENNIDEETRNEGEYAPYVKGQYRPTRKT